MIQGGPPESEYASQVPRRWPKKPLHFELVREACPANYDIWFHLISQTFLDLAELAVP